MQLLSLDQPTEETAGTCASDSAPKSLRNLLAERGFLSIADVDDGDRRLGRLRPPRRRSVWRTRGFAERVHGGLQSD